MRAFLFFAYYINRKNIEKQEYLMGRKTGGLYTVLTRWVYENRKQRTKIADIIKSMAEIEKELEKIEIKKKKK